MDEPDAEDLATEARRLRVKFGVAVAVVLAAAVTLGLLAGGRPVGPRHGSYRAATTDPLGAALPLLRAFVENQRGLTFTATVAVRTVDAATFTASEQASAIPARTAAGTQRDRTASALGLTPGDGPAVPAGSADGDAYYSYLRHAIYLRRGTVDAHRRALLVYELTQALDDQHHSLLTMTRTAAGDADQLRALDGLVRGDARRVEQAYAATVPARERTAIRAGDPYAARPTTYPGNAATFPVTAGAAFVAALVEHGGNDAVEAAFAHPPTGTAQILTPQRYLDGQGPVTVRDPETDGAVVDRGSLGVFGLAMLLSHGRSYLDTGVSGQWQGDQYATVRSAKQTCVLDTVLVGSEVGRDQFAHQLGSALGTRGTVAASDLDNSVTLRSCQRT